MLSKPPICLFFLAILARRRHKHNLALAWRGESHPLTLGKPDLLFRIVDAEPFAIIHRKPQLSKFPTTARSRWPQHCRSYLVYSIDYSDDLAFYILFQLQHRSGKAMRAT